MTLDTALSFGFGLICGAALGMWRVWVFARKLIHHGVSLDAWSSYDEATEQARGQRPRALVSPLRREGDLR